MVSLINNDSAVKCNLIFCFKFTTQLYLFLGFKVVHYSRCQKWEWELVGIGLEVMGKIGMGMPCWNGNGLE